MGLLKPIMAPLGIPLEYHRITNIMIFTNVQNVINVSSYFTKEQRDEELEGLGIEMEKNRLLADGVPIDALPEDNAYKSPYIEGSDYILPYDQYMTIESAYDYLKTLPEFEGAIDC